MFKNQTINKYIKELSSSSPTPGGGSTAAITGAFSASLVEMVANLTIGKKGYEKFQAEIIRIKNKSHNIKNKLLILADKDSEAFKIVMKEYKSKKKSSEKIERALKQATEVPMETIILTTEILKLAKRINEIGNKNTGSDSLSAVYLSKASSLCALENIKINLNEIKDKKYKERIENRIKDLQLATCRC